MEDRGPRPRGLPPRYQIGCIPICTRRVLFCTRTRHVVSHFVPGVSIFCRDRVCRTRHSSMVASFLLYQGWVMWYGKAMSRPEARRHSVSWGQRPACVVGTASSLARHPAPYTLRLHHPTPYTLHPTPYALTTPYTLHHHFT